MPRWRHAAMHACPYTTGYGGVCHASTSLGRAPRRRAAAARDAHRRPLVISRGGAPKFSDPKALLKEYYSAVDTMKLLVFFAIVAVAAAQRPWHCTAPAEFEARVSELDHVKKFESRARLSYDGINRRVRMVDEVNIQDKKGFYDILYLHDEGVEYVYDFKTKKCEKRRISREWRPVHIPYNATNYGEAYIGSSSAAGDGVLVTNWAGQDSKGDRYFMTWTYKDCIPITTGFISQKVGFLFTSYYDVVLGISDPNVFIPPKECGR